MLPAVPGHLRLPLLFAAALAITSPSTAYAQAEAMPGAREPWLLWSHESPHDRLMWAMWTDHLGGRHNGISNDKLIGIVYGGFYAATFRTTKGPRGYTMGIERGWLSTTRESVEIMLGYRFGLMHGYDGRLGWLAGKYPILPYGQPVLLGRVGPLTLDLTYTWVVVSLAAGLRF